MPKDSQRGCGNVPASNDGIGCTASVYHSLCANSLGDGIIIMLDSKFVQISHFIGNGDDPMDDFYLQVSAAAKVK